MEAKKKGKGNRFIFWLAAIAGLCLLFNFVAIPLGWGGINADGGILGAIQLAILVGFLVVLSFDILSLGWLLSKVDGNGKRGKTGGLIALGVLSLVAIQGAKVMVDEIAREMPLGRAGGEWGMLYAFLAFQLAYIIVVFSRAKPGSP